MGSLMQDFKRQASFFLREKLKTARLALTDVTPAQILTEEVTNGDSLAPDVLAMRLISRAAFEVDDYERIVHVLHHRLSKFDAQNWRASYKALVVLEHLLTHGPQRTAEEFENDVDTITHMASFHCLDHKGFDWGLSMKKKSERIIKLIGDRSYLIEERARARKLITVGIKGFGSSDSQLPARATVEENSKADDKIILRSNSDQQHFIVREAHEYATKLLTMPSHVSKYTSLDEHVMDIDHPFWDREHQARVSLLSSV